MQYFEFRQKYRCLSVICSNILIELFFVLEEDILFGGIFLHDSIQPSKFTRSEPVKRSFLVMQCGKRAYYFTKSELYPLQ